MLANLLTMAAAAEGGGFNPFEFAPGAAIWTWIAFLLALPLMWKFVYGPITKALADRDLKLEDAIRSAEEARRKAEEQVAAARKELDAARVESQRMVQEAVARAERQGQESLREAKNEADRQLRRARETIEAEKQKALVEIRKEVVDLSIASAKRILGREVDDAAQRKMVQEFLTGVVGSSQN